MANFRRGIGLLRKSFGKIKETVSLPDLIEIQSKSFNDFVQLDSLPTERASVGLEKVLKDIFPIEHGDKISLEYVSYELGNWECICGQLTGLANRYKWNCYACKKFGNGRIGKGGVCPSCETKGSAEYQTCKKCLSRVAVKMPITVEECRYSGKTYSMPLKIKVQLTTWETDAKGVRNIRDIKEQEVFFCDMPVMVDLYEGDDNKFYLGSHGTFLINGVDRVVVSQMQRSPGVVFSHSKKTKDYRGNPFHVARIIPSRGSWLDFEFDHNDLLYVRIDKKKKLLATTLLQALGVEKNSILKQFYNFEEVFVKDGNFFKKVDNNLVGQRLEPGILPKDIEELFVVGQRLTKESIEKLLKKKIVEIPARKPSLVNRALGQNLVHPKTGEVLAEQGELMDEDLVEEISKLPNFSFKVVQAGGYVSTPTIALTIAADANNTREEALKDLYYKLRPGDIAELRVMEEYINNLFFNSRFYDLSILGRIRTNRKLGINVDTNITHLTKEDLVATVRYLVNLKERGEGELDDIDHLGNRCVRLVGELIQSQVYLGFARIERIVRERLRLQEHHGAMMPYDFLNVKPLSAVLREFFGTGQLSQFMDQTNPLSEIAHKRRLSALGPGGITRERATFEVRDVHQSHYGRICPIETPEGHNIGLISSLSTYAKVNELGFIETTYRPIKNGKISDEVVSLDAFEEANEVIAMANTPVNENGTFAQETVFARKGGNIVATEASKVTYIDASPKQLVSVATALIPFLEHDDANRALMGSNMQRQAVPLIKCEAPLVGTGIEHELGKQEGPVLISKNDGIVKYVDADKIVVRIDEKNRSESEWFSKPIDIYQLKKYSRSNHNTWVHHAPIVKAGDVVKKGDILTDGPAIKNGEMALGSNLLVAFMPWYGYNFEDAIVLNKRLVSDDAFTSVHVEEFVCEARDTKLGPEEITRDIPNVGERTLEALDEDGIIRIGTRVKPGDILVGKVTLKGDVQYSPEEKLLRAIFGEKSREVRDTSLRVPPGVEATVIDVKVFSRSGIRKDKRYKEIVDLQTKKIEKDFNIHVSVLKDGAKKKILDLVKDSKLAKLSADELVTHSFADKKTATKVKEIAEMLSNQVHVLEATKENQINKLKKGDDLPSGVIKMVRVFLAMKRHVSVGDKVAGRHGNKGVISRIVNREDMPFLADGTSVDIVLNPLGVPGRMNVGQILETVMGLAGKTIGKDVAKHLEEQSFKEARARVEHFLGKDVVSKVEKEYGADGVNDLIASVAKNGFAITTPIFDGANYENEIKPLCKELKLSEKGNYTLYNGFTGEPFDQPVTVGYIYMMKLNHLADDKLHARSVGPYSLITQQPLGGKAQFGGQRLGEMEVWALYAYGAAYTLQEMLTVKSDDVNGRVKVYESIVRGDEVAESGIPESFNVLVKELQSLGLSVELFKASKEQISE